MSRSRRVGLAFLFFVVLQSFQAVAEAPPPDLARCAAITSAVERLDCFDALARRLASVEAGYQAVVSEVQHADSVIVLRNGTKETIRLAEVDAPELPQPYGSEARAYVTGLLMRQTVSVRPVTKDQYGRTVADIVMSDGQSLSRDLVEHGYAWLFIKHSSNAELAKLEREARAERRGLWKDPNPTAPWEFRHPEMVAAIDQNKPLAPAAIAPATAAKKVGADQEQTVYVTRTGTKYHRAG